MKQLVILLIVVVVVGLAAGGYALYSAWWNSNYVVVEQTDYNAPVDHDGTQLADDALDQKNPTFDAALVDSRPLGDWQLNASAAVVRLDCPMIKPDTEAAMLVLRPSYAAAMKAARQAGLTPLPSANLIDGAAKQFDDGLYAALDVACFRGELGPAPAAPQWVAAVFQLLPKKSPARPFLGRRLGTRGQDGRTHGRREGGEGPPAGRVRARQGRQQADRLLRLDARVDPGVAVLSLPATRVHRRRTGDPPRHRGRAQGQRETPKAVSRDRRLLRQVDEPVDLPARRRADRHQAESAPIGEAVRRRARVGGRLSPFDQPRNGTVRAGVSRWRARWRRT